MSLSYEEQRRANIKENEELLKSLGLATPGPIARPVLTKTPSNASIKKRARPASPRDAVVTPAKMRKSESTPTPSSGLRRSTRSTASAKKSYAEDGENAGRASRRGSPGSAKGAKMLGDDDFVDEIDDEPSGRVKQRNNKALGVRLHDPKQYGAIPDVEVGRWWATRQECSTDAIHAPFVAGISGNPIDGAYSVALSGGYPDDVDLGVAFTYTGCGGRDLKGTKNNPKNLRTAAQTFNQSFDHPMNAALKRSAETRKPVRVIRGFKLPSTYAPAEGYRYDGLYIVERAWMGKGLTNGLLVCRYAFKRMPGQPPLPVREEEPAMSA